MASGLQYTDGGDEGIRTPGLCLAKAALSQLSHIPTCEGYCCTPVLPCQRTTGAFNHNHHQVRT